MNSRGSANMWWIIIGAVIALVVMIVLMVIFTGKTNTLEKGLLSCESKGGQCLEKTDCTNKKGVASSFECPVIPKKENVCCFGIKTGG